MFEPAIIALIFFTFLIAGGVKGVIGLGLPTVSLALLTIAVDLPTAMALMLVPSTITNLWQAMSGGHGRQVFARIWPFLLAATATIWIGALALSRLDFGWLSALFGGLLIIYATNNLLGIRLRLSVPQERVLGPLMGMANGILTGLTGSFVVPGVLYLQAIGLARDMLVQAMGMLFVLSTLGLALALGEHGLLTTDLGLASGFALLPAAFGMVIGQKVRRRMSETLFRRIFFSALLILGVYIAVTAVAGLI